MDLTLATGALTSLMGSMYFNCTVTVKWLH